MVIVSPKELVTVAPGVNEKLSSYFVKSYTNVFPSRSSANPVRATNTMRMSRSVLRKIVVLFIIIKFLFKVAAKLRKVESNTKKFNFFLPRRSNFAIFDGKGTKGRVKNQINLYSKYVFHHPRGAPQRALLHQARSETRLSPHDGKINKSRRCSTREPPRRTLHPAGSRWRLGSHRHTCCRELSI